MPKSASNYSKTINTCSQYLWGWECVESGQQRSFNNPSIYKKSLALHCKKCDACKCLQQHANANLSNTEMRTLHKQQYYSKTETVKHYKKTDDNSLNGLSLIEHN